MTGAVPSQKKEVVEEVVDEKDKVGRSTDNLRFCFEIKIN